MKSHLFLAAAALALCGQAAFSQPPAPISGTVKSLAVGHVVVTTAAGDVDVLTTPQTRVISRVAATAPEIKAGAYLGTANVNTPEGGVASEVHLMESGPNVANTAMAAPNTVMTNGHVKSVMTTAKGQEMDVDYGGAQTRRVVVPANTPVTRMVAATLAVGQAVTVRAAPGADGKPTASFIQVNRPN